VRKWIILGVLIGSAVAHEGATGIIAERMDTMDAISEANRTLVSISRGRADFDLATVQSAASVITKNAGQSLVDMFPEGSISDTSEAKADIWLDFDRFSNLAMNLESTAKVLSQITSEDEFKSSFDAMAKNCGGCHRNFREKKR
jgi:cytochrome c556